MDGKSLEKFSTDKMDLTTSARRLDGKCIRQVGERLINENVHSSSMELSRLLITFHLFLAYLTRTKLGRFKSGSRQSGSWESF